MSERVESETPPASMTSTLLWFVATSREPVTPAQAVDELGLDSEASTVSTTLKRLFENDLLVRRRRPTDEAGPDPYEYVLADHDGVPVVFSDGDAGGSSTRALPADVKQWTMDDVSALSDALPEMVKMGSAGGSERVITVGLLRKHEPHELVEAVERIEAIVESFGVSIRRTLLTAGYVGTTSPVVLVKLFAEVPGDADE